MPCRAAIPPSLEKAAETLGLLQQKDSKGKTLIRKFSVPQKKDGSGVNVYPIFLAAANAANYDLEGLQHVMEATLKADQALVTTGLDHRLVLHRLIVEIASARKTPAARGR